ncbi:MAG: homoserine dehydrogenase [Acidobacteriota bacterium]|jgi:homoserine dehydrogenase|nr:homoserine dehydrogenase [Acidobacteriota bacterium]
MKKFNLCLLGFGNVGRALVQLLLQKEEELRDEFDIDWRVTGIASRRMGWLAAPEGFAAEELTTGELSARVSPAPDDVQEWLAAARCDVLFEVTSLEPLTGEPAVSHARAGLEHGAHVITANKGTIVHAYRELSELARARGRSFMYEATVIECPVFSLFRSSLPAARLLSFEGVLNSTTNVILDEITAGRTFDEGVCRAQDLGIAETDPTHDVDGWDSAVKACALANVLMGAELKLEEVVREGIRDLKDEDIRAAHAEGRPFRLVSRAGRDEAGRVKASVRPEQIQPRGPFAAVKGTTLAIHYELDMLPGLTVVAHDPDLTSTAYGLLADFINAVRG